MYLGKFKKIKKEKNRFLVYKTLEQCLEKIIIETRNEISYDCKTKQNIK